jgi:polyferredoxin
VTWRHASSDCRTETDIPPFTRLLFVAYFIEVGLLLIVVPWSAFWDRNYFLAAWPLLHTALDNNFARGAISGIGFVNVCAGVIELVSLLVRRRR